jgi:hypothetical protein
VLTPAGTGQGDLFNALAMNPRRQQLMEAMDRLNQRLGPNTHPLRGSGCAAGLGGGRNYEEQPFHDRPTRGAAGGYFATETRSGRVTIYVVYSLRHTPHHIALSSINRIAPLFQEWYFCLTTY